MKTDGKKLPEDFTVNGWNKANNFGVDFSQYESKAVANKERFRRSGIVMRAYQQTDTYKEAMRVAATDAWNARVMKAKNASDTAEVLLLEGLIAKRYEGDTAAEIISSAITNIACELAKRGTKNIDELDTKELIQISNMLLGLTKAASAAKRTEGWKPNVQVNNVTVNNSSKTGGVVGGLKDVIDLRVDDKTNGVNND